MTQLFDHIEYTEDERTCLELLSKYDQKEQRAILSDIIGSVRASKLIRAFEYRITNIHLAVEQPFDPHNAAAMVRSAEAMGLIHMHAITTNKEVFNAKATTQGAYHWMFLSYFKTTEKLYTHCKKRNIAIAACTMDGETPINALDLSKPTCLIFGNEHHGLSNKALEEADTRVCIPMYGLSESLNLSVSAAICCYALSTRIRNTEGASIPLNAEEESLLIVRALLKTRRFQHISHFLASYMK